MARRRRIWTSGPSGVVELARPAPDPRHEEEDENSRGNSAAPQAADCVGDPDEHDAEDHTDVRR